MKSSFIKRFTVLFLCLLLTSPMACGSNRQAQRDSSPVTPKPMVTPWEYYKGVRSAELRSSDAVKLQKAEMQTMGEDTKKDKTHYILIGTLVGVVVIGGTVAAILLTR